MANYWENDEYIHDLKAAADLGEAADRRGDTTSSHLSGSRAAMLALVDDLARQSVPQLGIIAVSTMSLAAIYCLNLPQLSVDMLMRAALWLIMVTVTLGFAAYRLRQFRQGFAYNGKPFTWRSHYTSSMAVLSTTVGTGAALLTPSSLSFPVVLVICAMTLAVAAITAFGHTAHRMTALMASLPSAILALTAPFFHLRELPAEIIEQFLLFWVISVMTAIATGFIVNNRAISKAEKALKAHPRNELAQIEARQKRMSSAYNPFSMR